MYEIVGRSLKIQSFRVRVQVSDYLSVCLSIYLSIYLPIRTYARKYHDLSQFFDIYLCDLCGCLSHFLPVSVCTHIYVHVYTHTHINIFNPIQYIYCMASSRKVVLNPHPIKTSETQARRCRLISRFRSLLASWQKRMVYLRLQISG